MYMQSYAHTIIHTHTIIYRHNHTHSHTTTHTHNHTHSHNHIHTQPHTHYFLPTHKCTLSYAHWQTHTLTQEPHLCFLPLIAPFPVLHKILTEQGDGGAPSLLNTHLPPTANSTLSHTHQHPVPSHAFSSQELRKQAVLLTPILQMGETFIIIMTSQGEWPFVCGSQRTLPTY